MSTLPLHVQHVPTVPAFARLLAALGMLIEVFAESQARARAAHERYPFVDW